MPDEKRLGRPPPVKVFKSEDVTPLIGFRLVPLTTTGHRSGEWACPSRFGSHNWGEGGQALLPGTGERDPRGWFGRYSWGMWWGRPLFQLSQRRVTFHYRCDAMRQNVGGTWQVKKISLSVKCGEPICVIFSPG